RSSPARRSPATEATRATGCSGAPKDHLRGPTASRGPAHPERLRQRGIMIEISEAEFEEAVRDALDEVPPQLLDMLDNVACCVEDGPGAEQPDPVVGPEENAELLGISLGTPRTERGGGWAMGALPGGIVRFRGTLSRMCRDMNELREG